MTQSADDRAAMAADQRIPGHTQVAPQYTLIVHAGSEPVAVSEWIWRSWTGRRFLNGVEYHGPVYFLGSEKVSRDNV